MNGNCMLNKLLIFFSFCLFSFFVNAQNIHLQKNGMFKKREIKLPKMMSIEYKDSGNIKNLRGKTIRYKFPFLYLVVKRDTFRMDVKNIIQINYNNSIAAPLIVGYFALTTVGTAAGFLDFIYGNPYGGLVFIGAGYITYKLYGILPKEFNTETQWSFY